MRLFRNISFLLFLFTLTSICNGQNKAGGYVYTDSFYDPQIGIIRLVDALKSANPNFLKMTVEERFKESKRITQVCSDSENKETKIKVINSDEEKVCLVIKDIAASLQEFKKRHEFAVLIDANAYESGIICFDGVDVTKQFIDEYNRAQK